MQWAPVGLCVPGGTGTLVGMRDLHAQPTSRPAAGPGVRAIIIIEALL